MQSRAAALGAIALALLSTSACASAASPASADLSGQWTLTMDPDFKGSRSSVDCDLQQQRDEFTIKCGTTGQMMKGKVSGSTATWGFTGPGAYPLPQDPVTLTYAADVGDAGASLKGTWRITSGIVNEKGNFEAKRKTTATQ